MSADHRLFKLLNVDLFYFVSFRAICSQNPTLPGAEPTPLAGVSSFMIERKPSGASVAKRPSQKSRSGSQSGPTSPSTPTYPEGKPLLDKGDDPVVFNFGTVNFHDI